MLTVSVMRPPSELVVIQILLIEEPGERAYDRLLSFSGGKPTRYSRVAPLFCTPVLSRVPIETFVEQMMSSLVTAGLVAEEPIVVATPAVRISPAVADSIIEAYRREADRITRHVEVAALDAMWELNLDDGCEP